MVLSGRHLLGGIRQPRFHCAVYVRNIHQMVSRQKCWQYAQNRVLKKTCNANPDQYLTNLLTVAACGQTKQQPKPRKGNLLIDFLIVYFLPHDTFIPAANSISYGIMFIYVHLPLISFQFNEAKEITTFAQAHTTGSSVSTEIYGNNTVLISNTVHMIKLLNSLASVILNFIDY